MRPTRGVAGLVVLAGVLHLLARATGGAWLSLAAGACLGLPAAALLLRPRLADVQVQLSPVRARVGEPLELRIAVRNAGSRPSPALLLREPSVSGAVLAVPALAPGGEVVAQVRGSATRRRWSPVVQVELSSTAPFGLLRATRRAEAAGPVVVAPRRLPAAELAAAGGGSGGSSRPVPGTGTEVLGLRAWRPGDGVATVHARASARAGRPVVLERERETGPSLVVLCAGPGEGPLWEAAVEQACALAEEAARAGRAPVLVAAGLAERPRADVAAVLDWHARVDEAQPLDGPTLARAVRSAGRGGALVLLAPPALVLDRTAAARRACAAAGVALTVLGPA